MDIPDELNATIVGGNLGAQVGHIVLNVAGGRENLTQPRVIEDTAIDDLERDDGDALLVKRARVWRHATRRDASHVRVVPPGRDKEDKLPVIEHRGNGSDVG